MVTPELIDYIKNRIVGGIDQSIIRQELVSKGWNEIDISSAFNSLITTNSPTVVPPVQTNKKSSKKACFVVLISLLLLIILIPVSYFAILPAIRYQIYANQVDKVGLIQKNIAPYTPPNYVITDVAKIEEIAYGNYGYYTRMKDSSTTKNDLITINMQPKHKWTCPSRGTWNQIGLYNVCITPMSVGYWSIWDKDELTINVVANNNDVSIDEIKKVIQSF